MGVSGGVWECGKPERFSIISMPQSEGEKGEVTFSLRPRRGRSLAPPFPPMGLQNVDRIPRLEECLTQVQASQGMHAFRVQKERNKSKQSELDNEY